MPCAHNPWSKSKSGLHARTLDDGGAGLLARAQDKGIDNKDLRFSF